MSDILQQTVDRLRELLPLDLPPSAPVYLLSKYGLPPQYSTPGCGSLAYMSPWLDLQIRPNLEAEGRWKGRGFAAVIEEIGLLYGDGTELLEVLLHEVSHYFDRPPGCVVFLPLEKWPGEILFLAEPLKPRDPNKSAVVIPPLPPWAWHGEGFIRAAIHVHHRAQQHGFAAPLESLTVAGKGYGLSPAAQYADALRDEPERFAGLPLVEALQSPAPAMFHELFQADCAHWHRAGCVGSGVSCSAPSPRPGISSEGAA